MHSWVNACGNVLRLQVRGTRKHSNCVEIINMLDARIVIKSVQISNYVIIFNVRHLKRCLMDRISNCFQTKFCIEIACYYDRAGNRYLKVRYVPGP